jgi:hypothetical protein
VTFRTRRKVCVSPDRKGYRFLYFPDENHWILRPGDIKVWYETVFAFLAENVLREEWRRRRPLQGPAARWPGLAVPRCVP